MSHTLTAVAAGALLATLLSAQNEPPKPPPDDDVPDYDSLLADMKESTAEGSKERKKAGYAGVTLIGWAEPPHYDAAQHKLYWAERLRFEGNDGDTLNYNVRVLGRSGHLVVNGVGDIDQ